MYIFSVLHMNLPDLCFEKNEYYLLSQKENHTELWKYY